MRIAAAILLSTITLAGPVLARAPDQPDYKKIEKHFSGNKTVIGETIRYPAGDTVNIQSLIVTLRPGESTGWHKHGVPTYGYILKGSLTVDYGEKGKRRYHAGEAFMDAMNWWHNGLNESQSPVRVLVVFMGAKGTAPVLRDGAPKEKAKQ